MLINTTLTLTITSFFINNKGIEKIFRITTDNFADTYSVIVEPTSVGEIGLNICLTLQTYWESQ